MICLVLLRWGKHSKNTQTADPQRQEHHSSVNIHYKHRLRYTCAYTSSHIHTCWHVHKNTDAETHSALLHPALALFQVSSLIEPVGMHTRTYTDMKFFATERKWII